MRIPVLVILLAVLLAGAVGAQAPIKLPAYTSSFSTSSATRGYYFQAPTAFTVVALKVPDEKSHGKQNVALFKLTGAPPAFSTTAQGGLRFTSLGTSSSLWINCHVAYNQGDWVGILGACGDTSIMHNSYGAGAFKTKVLGADTTLFRMLTQFNLVSLVTNKVPIKYSSEGTGSIARVRCAVIASPDLQAKGDGSIGTSVNYTLTSTADAGLGYQMGTSLTSGPIPVRTRNIWLGVDSVLILSVSGLATGTFTGYSGTLSKTGGTAAASLSIPKLTALQGVGVATAYVTLRATAPQGVNGISGSHEFKIK